MFRIARWTHRALYILPLVVLFILMGVAANTHTTNAAGVPVRPGTTPFFAWSFGLFLFWLIFGRRIAVWFLPLLISKVRCPGCKDEIELVDRWNCACGYHDHKERHALSGTCPKCGSRTGHFDCPRCGATILLW